MSAMVTSGAALPLAGRGELQTALQEVLQRMVQGKPLRATLNLIARRVSELMDFTFCGIMLPDPHHRHIRIEGAYGFPEGYAQQVNNQALIRVSDGPLGAGPTSLAFTTAKPVVIRDVWKDPSFAPWRHLAREYGYRSVLSAPLSVQGSVIGVLNGYSRVRRAFSEAELDVIQTLADQASVAIRLAALLDNQQATIAQLQELNEKLEQQRWVLERSEEIHRELTAVVISGAGFEMVAGTLARLTRNPAAVWGANGHLLCTADCDPDGDISEMLRQPGLQRPLALARRRGKALHLPAAPRDGLAWGLAVAPILVGDELLGYVAIQEKEGPVGELDLRAVEHAATVLALEIVKQRTVRDTEERLRSDFLYDLLNGRYDSDERLSDRARHYGLNLAAEHRVLVVDVDDWDGYAQRHRMTEKEANLFRGTVLRVTSGALTMAFPDSMLTMVSDRISAVCPIPAGQAQPEPLLAALAEVQRRLQEVAPDLTISAGVGTICRTPQEFSRSCREATQCLQLIRRVGWRQKFLAADRLGLFRILLDTRDPEELIRFARQVAGSVVEYDRRTGTDLYRTLEVFLTGDCDVNACAQAMFIHLNTVKYRLRKVEQISGRSLRNPNDLMQFSLATLILRVLGEAAVPG